MADKFKPLLSATWEDRFAPVRPVLGSPKLDGVRCVLIDGIPMTRSLKKPVPNLHIREALRKMPWFDGELIVGSPTEGGCLRRTLSGVMAGDGEPDWTYYVFDDCDPSVREKPFTERYARAERDLERERARTTVHPSRLVMLPHRLLHSKEDIFTYEAECVGAGYEGLMIRDPNGAYKWGRATAKEGILTKIKRWEDAEAVILGVFEEKKNENEAHKNALGRTERSSHQANKTGKGTLGGYHCKTLWGGGGPELGYFALDGNTEFDPVLFDCGASANMTREERDVLWQDRDNLVGKIITFKYQHRLGADAPSHPVFKDFRLEE